MKSTQPTIIQLDETVAERAAALVDKGRPLGGRAFGILHAIITIWNRQRRPVQFKLVLADVARITGDCEDVIKQDVAKLKYEGLIVRLRHGNQYTKSVWQLGTELAEQTPSMTPQAAQSVKTEHEAQRLPQVERAATSPATVSATPSPDFDRRHGGAVSGGDLLDDILKQFGCKNDTACNTFASPVQPLATVLQVPHGHLQHHCKSDTATCTTDATLYSNTEFKNRDSSFLPEGREGGKIIPLKDLTDENAPFVIRPAAVNHDERDHKRYYKARYNVNAPTYPHPIETRKDGDKATFRNTLVDMNREPREWAGTKDGLYFWGCTWAWCMGLNPALVELEWRDFFEIKKTPCNSPTAAFKHHCMSNYESLRMTRENIEGTTWGRFGSIISID